MKKSILNNEIIKALGKDKLILMLVAGIVLVICTFWEGSEEEKTTNSALQVDNITNDDINKYINNQEERLEKLISNIEGTGNVEVMITVKETLKDNILIETDYERQSESESDAEGNRQFYGYTEDNQTVYMVDEAGNSIPYISNQTLPKIEGVAVICEGADSALVKEKIINVIMALFSVEINKISVTK